MEVLVLDGVPRPLLEFSVEQSLDSADLWVRTPTLQLSDSTFSYVHITSDDTLYELWGAHVTHRKQTMDDPYGEMELTAAGMSARRLRDRKT